jgi:hypothetical protein
MPHEGHGYIDYDGDEERFWFVETLWAAARAVPAEEVPLDALPWRADGCHVLGTPPTWGALADHCARAMSAEPRFPVVVGPDGEVMDGMHRLVRAAVEGRETVSIARLPAAPPPDRVRPREGWSLDDFRARMVAWAAREADVVALALVGSQARGEARPDSDVDVIVLTTERPARLARRRWLTRLGGVRRVREKLFDAITSLVVDFDRGPQVELGLGEPSWAALARTDPATLRVVRAGFVPWYDPGGLLEGVPPEMG